MASTSELTKKGAEQPGRDHEAHARRIANRLKRARGQLDGLINAFESGVNCRDVVTQLAAVSKALDRAGFLIISTAMQDCLREDDGQSSSPSNDKVDLDDLERLFLMLT